MALCPIPSLLLLQLWLGKHQHPSSRAAVTALQQQPSAAHAGMTTALRLRQVRRLVQRGGGLQVRRLVWCVCGGGGLQLCLFSRDLCLSGVQRRGGVAVVVRGCRSGPAGDCGMLSVVRRQQVGRQGGSVWLHMFGLLRGCVAKVDKVRGGGSHLSQRLAVW